MIAKHLCARVQRRLYGVGVPLGATVVLTLFLFMILGANTLTTQKPIAVQGGSCSTPETGYRCFEKYSRSWGVYSPYFSLRDISKYPTDIPSGCEATFAAVLSRHGARYPTLAMGTTMTKLIARIQNKTVPERYGPGYQFLETFDYQLGSDILVDVGRHQLFESGAHFYDRYKHLAKDANPFVRSSPSPRCIESAKLFKIGYSQMRVNAGGKPVSTTVDVVMHKRGGGGSNSTLQLGSCPSFESDLNDQPWIGSYQEKHFSATLERVKQNLPGASLGLDDIVTLMDLCPFHTVSFIPDADQISPFCLLFTEQEWHAYDYLKTLTKYYKYGGGNKLAPSNGIGWVNELIARLTNESVQDNTNTNRTLDSDPKTFPLGLPLYADFGHDNSMETVYAALGLPVPILPKVEVQGPEDIDYFTASRMVPFAGRMYVEKMQCGRGQKEYVRVLVNDRVVPTNGCPVDHLGRCELSQFIKGLEFARTGGDYEMCFKSKLTASAEPSPG